LHQCSILILVYIIFLSEGQAGRPGSFPKAKLLRKFWKNWVGKNSFFVFDLTILQSKLLLWIPIFWSKLRIQQISKFLLLGDPVGGRSVGKSTVKRSTLCFSGSAALGLSYRRGGSAWLDVEFTGVTGLKCIFWGSGGVCRCKHGVGTAVYGRGRWRLSFRSVTALQRRALLHEVRATKAWRVLSLWIDEQRPPDRKGSCECIE